jgi:hypothetical protein
MITKEKFAYRMIFFRDHAEPCNCQKMAGNFAAPPLKIPACQERGQAFRKRMTNCVTAPR